MTKFVAKVSLIGLCGAFAIFQGCDWDDTGSGSYNTSQGGGINVNFSGYYRPKSGSFLVTSNVTHFVMTQIGNSLEVYDNNNSYYTGSIGSPGMMSEPNVSTMDYPAGAEMLQAQVSFSGKNAATGQDVSFVGVIHVVAVDDVQGTTSTETTTAVDSTSTNTLGVTSIDIVAPPVTISDTTTTESEDSNGVELTVETTTTYQITEQNTQYVLDGNWIEGGAVTGISAIAPGTASTFSSSSSETTTTTGARAQ